MTAAPDIFLSYNREDQAVARRFAEAFEVEGFSVWWDAALKAGEAYDEVTETALRMARAVVVLWSPRSVVSRWVRAEATLADRNKTLVPCTIEPCDRPIMFELTQTAELAHWDGEPADKAWKAFLTDVRRFVEKASAAPATVARHEPDPVPPVRGAGKRGSAPTLAVLPFTNRSGLADDEVFAEGMVEDVIAALAQGAHMRVLGRMATANLRRETITDPAAVGRQLDVRYLLEGNVRRVGSGLRVTTQLLEAATGEVLWAGRFDRPLTELADLQEELVLEVAARLDIQVTGLEMERALRKPGDLTAWEAVMRSLSATQHLDAPSLSRGLEDARNAVAIDPDYALAHAAAAQCSAVLYLLSSLEDPSEVRLIRRHIDRALELGPEDPLVLTYVGVALVYIGYREEAHRCLARAVARLPGNGLAHYGYGTACSFLDRTDEALGHCETSLRLMQGSPLLWSVFAMKANALIRAGRWDEAMDQLDESLALNPDGSIIRLQQAICYRHLGRHAEARRLFALARTVDWSLAQMETWFHRVMVGNPVLDEHIAHIRALWAEAQGET